MKKGFTLIELLVVIAIIGILAAIPVAGVGAGAGSGAAGQLRQQPQAVDLDLQDVLE